MQRFKTFRLNWKKPPRFQINWKARGPVAQRLEPGTHNLAFGPRRTFRHWTACEQTRRLATENDRHSVNMPSTVSRVGGDGNDGNPNFRCNGRLVTYPFPLA